MSSSLPSVPLSQNSLIFMGSFSQLRIQSLGISRKGLPDRTRVREVSKLSAAITLSSGAKNDNHFEFKLRKLHDLMLKSSPPLQLYNYELQMPKESKTEFLWISWESSWNTMYIIDQLVTLSLLKISFKIGEAAKVNSHSGGMWWVL